MTTITIADGWTPHRRGEVYCSPRCGAGCTHAAFERATAEAEALCSRLGEGWRPRVWENMGWHYAAQKGCLALHPNTGGSTVKPGWRVTGYTAFFNSARQIVIRDESPFDAVSRAVRDARQLARCMLADATMIAGAEIIGRAPKPSNE